jgi:hypothetical protein
MIDLTQDQLRALATEGESAILVDPKTRQQYRLVRTEVNDQVRSPLETAEVPPGVKGSREALLRDLPELLRTRRNRGLCACYHGNLRIAIGHEADLIRAAQKLGLRRSEYYIGVIEESESVEEEEIEVFRPDLVEEPNIPCQPS